MSEKKKNKKVIILVVGCGHTGTTLISGILFFSGYRILGTPNSTFESNAINTFFDRINFCPKDNIYKLNLINFFKYGAAKVKGKKWVIKDPLLTFHLHDVYTTLKQLGHKVKIIVNLRNPGQTINHLSKETAEWLNCPINEKITRNSEKQYLDSYQEIIKICKKLSSEDYLIIDYEKLINKKDFDKVEIFLKQKLNKSFVKKRLNRSVPLIVPAHVNSTYQEMKQLSKSNIDIYNIQQYNIRENLSSILRKILYKPLLYKLKFIHLVNRLTKFNYPYIRQ